MVIFLFYFQWISSTILQRIVEEIAVINTGLRKQGLAGLAVGSVGLETLTNTAHNIIVAHNIPSLPFLIPFLQLSSNQQYIVQRIKELAIGSSMSEYRWKSGGKFNDKEWDSHLPTDAELVMHLVCTYLDSQLPLLPTQPDARPFTTKYLVKVKEQPIQKELAIRQHSVHPPHYNLIINGEIQDIPQV
ncbi:hypothetical protein AAG570_008078 [Ranatra chinensis]|uniref:Uncharacterized protein n=1 Tax=Ranatra chinensis TaxID=642074 RepID=A0ABD0XVP7_9HEMI